MYSKNEYNLIALQIKMGYWMKKNKLTFHFKLKALFS